MAPPDGNVSRRHSQLTPQLGPMNHSTAHAKGAPHHTVGQIEVTGGQRLAHPSAANPLPANLKGLGMLDAKTFFSAHLFKKVEVAGSIAAKPEVVADHQMPDHRSEEHTSELQSRETLVCRL